MGKNPFVSLLLLGLVLGMGVFTVIGASNYLQTGRFDIRPKAYECAEGYTTLDSCCRAGKQARTYRFKDCHTESRCDYDNPSCLSATEGVGQCAEGYISLDECCGIGKQYRTYRKANCEEEKRCDYDNPSCAVTITPSPTSISTTPLAQGTKVGGESCVANSECQSNLCGAGPSGVLLCASITPTPTLTPTPTPTLACIPDGSRSQVGVACCNELAPTAGFCRNLTCNHTRCPNGCSALTYEGGICLGAPTALQCSGFSGDRAGCQTAGCVYLSTNLCVTQASLVETGTPTPIPTSFCDRSKCLHGCSQLDFYGGVCVRGGCNDLCSTTTTCSVGVCELGSCKQCASPTPTPTLAPIVLTCGDVGGACYLVNFTCQTPSTQHRACASPLFCCSTRTSTPTPTPTPIPQLVPFYEQPISVPTTTYCTPVLQNACEVAGTACVPSEFGGNCVEFSSLTVPPPTPTPTIFAPTNWVPQTCDTVTCNTDCVFEHNYERGECTEYEFPTGVTNSSCSCTNF